MTTGDPTPQPPHIDHVEIYIDPDGSVTITDLPAELMPLYESLQRSLTHGEEAPPTGR